MLSRLDYSVEPLLDVILKMNRYKCSVLHIFPSQRLAILTTPSSELPKTKQEQEKLLAIFAADGDSLHQKAPPTKDGYFPVDEKESHC